MTGPHAKVREWGEQSLSDAETENDSIWLGPCFPGHEFPRIPKLGRLVGTLCLQRHPQRITASWAAAGSTQGKGWLVTLGETRVGSRTTSHPCSGASLTALAAVYAESLSGECKASCARTHMSSDISTDRRVRWIRKWFTLGPALPGRMKALTPRKFHEYQC